MDKNTSSGIKKTQQALEKRLMLDAAAVFAAVQAIPNAVLHLDGQDVDADGDTSAGDQPANGVTVATWVDGGQGQNNSATKSNGSHTLPTFDANAFGPGRGGFNFNGTSDELTISNQNGLNSSGPWSQKSFAFTFKTSNDVNSFQIIYEQGGGIRGYHVAISGGNLYVSGYNDTGSEWGADRFKVMNHGSVQTNTVYNVIMVFDTTEGANGVIKSSVNGGNFITLQSVGAQANHTANIGIGGINGQTVDPTNVGTFPSDGANFKGWIGEIWQWNHALTSQEISDLESYQALKWTNRPTIEYNTGGTVAEGGVLTLDNTQLNALDNDTPNTGLVYQLTGKTNGTIQLNGSDLILGATFTQDDIDNGRVTFTHDGSDTVSASFNFKLTDGGWLIASKFNISVTPVDGPGDDPPVIFTNNMGFVQSGGVANITQALLEVADADTAPGSLVYTVTATVDGSVFNTNLGMVVTSFTQADINNGYIQFHHSGAIAIPASFDFDVTDGTSTISGTYALDVDIVNTAANDPPVIRYNTGGDVSSGGTVAILTSNLQTVDPDNSINQLQYTITALDSGTVRRSGVALTVGQTFTQADIDYGIIAFRHDGSAGATASFSFDVTDGNTTISDVYNLNVVANDAPVINSLGPFSINENAANGLLIGTASAFDTDGDGLTYSIQSGNADGIFQINPINGQITIADNTNLNYEATASYSLVVRVTDDGVGFLYDETTVVINVTDVNDAPVLPASGPFSVGEFANDGTAVGAIAGTDEDVPADTLTYSISGGTGIGLFNIDGSGNITVNGNNNFNFETGTNSYTLDIVANDGAVDSNTITVTVNITDENDDPVLAAAGPFSIGELSNDGTAVGVVMATDVDVPADTITYSIVGGTGIGLFAVDNSGNITVNGNNNFDYDAGTTSYTLDVVANDGTVDSNTITVTVNITAEDDPPVLDVNAGVTVAEGGTVGITVAELSGSDADTASSDLVYDITVAPVNGQVELTTNAGVAVTSFTQEDLDNGLVQYVHDGGETTADSFNFVLTDGYYSLPVETYDIVVTPQNDKPFITTNVAPSVEVGDTIIFDNTMLLGSDPDDSPTDITFTVNNINNGTLTIDGVTAVNGSTFTQADINAGLVSFTHDGTMTITGSFDVVLADGGEDGATTDAATVVINVEFVPVLEANTGFTVLEGTSVAPSVNAITTTELSVSDFDTPDTDIVFKVIKSPTRGQLELTTGPGVAVTSFTQDDLENARVIYVHNGSETTSDSFTFEVSDGFYTLPVEKFDITITPQNDGPKLSANDPTDILEGGNFVVNKAILNASDSDDVRGSLLYTAGNIVNGYLAFVDAPNKAIYSFTQDDVDNEKIIFIHDGSETTTASFYVSVADGGEHGAQPALGVVTVGVIPVDDAPEIVKNKGVTVLEGQSAYINTSSLNSFDPDTDAKSLIYKVTGKPAHGQLEFSDAPGKAITKFTQADLNNNRIIYVHDGSETLSDSFRFVLSDATTILESNTFAIKVTPVNDAPERIVVDKTAFIENTAPGKIIAHWDVIDPDGPFAKVSIVGDPSIFGISGDGIYVTKALDYETDTHSYTITLRAWDGEFYTDQEVTFTLGDMNEAPSNSLPRSAEVPSFGSVDSGLWELNTFQPISNTFSNLSNQFDFGDSGTLLLRSVGFNGSDGLSSAFYGDQINQIIKDSIIDKISSVFDGIETDEGVFEGNADGVIFDTDSDSVTVDGQQGDGEYKQPVEKSKIVQALMRAGQKADEDHNAPNPFKASQSFADNTEVQLNEAALYYKNKQSKLESILLKRPSNN